MSRPQTALLAVLLVTSVLPSPLPAETRVAATAQSPEAVEAAIRRFVLARTAGLGQSVQVVVSPLEANSRTGHCAAPEVFSPPGTRLWGKSRVGVRCTSPTPWLAYRSVDVKVSGHYLVSSRKIMAGQTLTDADFESRQGEISQFPDDLIARPDDARGRKLRTGIMAAQPLRRDHLQRDPVIRPGQVVRIVVRGPGFTVSSEGKALAQGFAGEPVRVRLASGKTVQGKARADGLVEVEP